MIVRCILAILWSSLLRSLEAFVLSHKFQRRQKLRFFHRNHGSSSVVLFDASSPVPGNPRRRGWFLRRITGDRTPYKFPVRPLEFQKIWPPQKPFTPYAFSRLDYLNDGIFYTLPRLVYHIDEPAVAALTQYYRRSIHPQSDILDICSSWVSHFPTEFPDTMASISATGMNALEMACNDQLTAGYTVLDWNKKAQEIKAQEKRREPSTPLLAQYYEDQSFDVITCACSIDYLVDPVGALRECCRLLRPGGKVIVSFSNRCFGLKATRIWLWSKSPEHLDLLNAYFQYSGGFYPACAFDITAENVSGYQDPMFVVEATKK